MASGPFPYRILIVEDDPSLRELGRLLLTAQSYEVHGAGDGFEGLAALKHSLPDLIISDLRCRIWTGSSSSRWCGADFP